MKGDPPTPSNPETLWPAALAELRLQMTRATFTTRLAGSRAVREWSRGGLLTVVVASHYAKEWLTHRLGGLIARTVSRLAGRPVRVQFVVQAEPEGGVTPMAHPPAPTRARLYSQLTATTFFHVEDALEIGKLRLFAGAYQRGRSLLSHAHHFLDVADARVIFQALAQGQPGFCYRECKGTAAGQRVISRVLSVENDGDQVVIELRNGPGLAGAGGAVEPAGAPAARVAVSFDGYQARRLALVVLAFLRAWDFGRLLASQFPIAGLRPSLPLTSGKSSGAPGAGPARPPIRPESQGSTGSRPASQALHYQDDTLVNPNNDRERRAFLRYRQEMGEDPPSLAALRGYIRGRQRPGKSH